MGRWLRGWVVGTGIAVGLGCSGLPVPGMEAPVADAVVADPVVAELLKAEGGDERLTAEEQAARSAELGVFVAANADFAKWKAAVLDHLAANDGTIEQSYAVVKADFAPKEAPELAVEDADWEAVVIVSTAYSASEDWASVSAEVTDAMAERKIPVLAVGPGVREVKVVRAKKEIATIDLAPMVPEAEPLTGYALASAKGEPRWETHAPADAIVAAVEAHFGEGAAEDAPEQVASADRPAPGPKPAPSVVITPVPEEVVPEPVPVAAPAPQPRVPLPDLDTPDPVPETGKKDKGKKK